MILGIVQALTQSIFDQIFNFLFCLEAVLLIYFVKKLNKQKQYAKKELYTQGGQNPRKEGQGRPCFDAFYGVNW